MDEREAGRLGLELMTAADAAYVTTIDAEGFPRTRAMFNLRRKEQFPGLVELFQGHDADFLLYFTTNTSSAKLAHIQRNPRVAVYFSLPDEFRGLMLSGEMEIVADSTVKEALWQKGWESYYPQGPHDPDHTVLRLVPRSADYYQRLAVCHLALKGET